jgi:hypothetical protein
MQNNNSKGDLRLRQCVEEIILAKNIRKFEDFDTKTLASLRLPVAEIEAIIKKVWIKESDPYTRQIDKWMRSEESFDPAPPSDAGWFEPKDLLYKDMRFISYKAGAAFVQSAIELWHVTYRHLSPRDRQDPYFVFSLCPSVVTAPTRYFMVTEGTRAVYGPIYFELDVSGDPEWRKRKTVTGAIGSSAALSISERPRKEILEVEKPLLQIIKKHT